MKISDKIKYWIVNQLYDSRFKTKLNPSDSSSIYSIRKNRDSPFLVKDDKPLKEVKLNAVYLNEVFHINDYKKVRKGILKLARKKYAESDYISDIDFKELADNLESFSTAFDRAQFGKFLRLNFYKSKFHKNKPYYDVVISYHKTNESFIVLTIKISPIQKVIKQFEAICSSEDKSYMSPNFYSWKEIFTNRCFLKSQSINSSSKTENLNKEINELCRPIEKYFHKHLNGYFNNTEKKLPKIINIKISNTEELKKDEVLSRWLNFDECESTFEFNDQWVSHWYPSHSDEQSNKRLFIIDTNNSETTIYEHGKLIKSLSFFWCLENYFDLKRERTKLLKREIYDFANGFKVKRWNLFKSVFQRKYRKLKYNIAQDQIIYSIFNTEFDSKNKFSMYLLESKMQKYKNHNFCKKEEKELLHIVNADLILDKAKANNEEMSILNERFKPIEELNNFNTSTSLDTIAIVISILTIFLTYEKLKEVFVYLWSIIQ